MLYQGPCRADCETTGRGHEKQNMVAALMMVGEGGGGHPFVAVAAKLQLFMQ